jgi:cellulose synthase/poly-beta-1,6-N-acetylglucosamine synthase-like glycosyltransferase
MQWLSLLLLVALLGTVVVLCLIDRRKRRPAGGTPPVSFLIPCFNDGATIRTTVESIFRSYADGLFEILVADDCSTDDSARVLESLSHDPRVRLFRNEQNIGKARTLNNLVDQAHHDLIVFLDADTALSAKAMTDMLRRMNADSRMAAVSCPYQPMNRGLFACMQSIEYSMMTLVQGAYNVSSALAIWGGCFAVKKAAFNAAGRFTLSAITEDVDLAHKLGALGWRTEQSMVPVRSLVPDTLRGWMRQKIRWTAGAFQCMFRHPRVWMRNPLHVVLVFIYSIMSVLFMAGVIGQTRTVDRMVFTLDILNDFLPWNEALRTMLELYRPSISVGILPALSFSLISVVYVVPLISRLRDLLLVLLVVPFSLAYFPLYAIMSLVGFGYFGLVCRRLAQDARAW